MPEPLHDKLAESVDQTKAAAQSTASAAERTKDSADRRTELAADRTVFAAERTYAAWVRTGLVALASAPTHSGDSAWQLARLSRARVRRTVGLSSHCTAADRGIAA